MNESTGNVGASPEGEMTILRYRPGLGYLLRFSWLVPIVFGVVLSVVSIVLRQPVLSLALSLGLTACLILFVLSFDVVIGKEVIQFREMTGLLKAREVPLSSIAQIAVAKHSQWATARIAIVPEGARRRRFFVLSAKDTEVLLRGDMRFQAQVVKELLARRADILVADDAAKLLTGRLGVSWKHRLPALFTTGLGTVTLTYLLAVSIRELSAPLFFLVPQLLFWPCISFAVCLERESLGKAILASLGASALPLAAAAFAVAYVDGGLEYAPMVYAAGIVLAGGGLVAALSTRLRALHIAIVEAILVVGVVLGTWSATLRGTIPVCELYLAPGPCEASFSPSGRTLILHGSGEEGEAIHFLDAKTRQAKTVPCGQGRDVSMLVPIDDDRALCSGQEGRERKLWMVDSSGEMRELFSGVHFILITKSALSPDGGRFVFSASEERAEMESEVTPVILDLRTLGVQPLDFLGRRDLCSVAWRADGRLALMTISGRDAQGAGRFSLWSWALGEEEPRLDFESDEPWSGVWVSPRCDMALATVHTGDAQVHRLVRFHDREGVDVPPVALRSLSSERCWSADGRILVAALRDNPRAVVVIRTDTGGTSIIHESAFGEVDTPVISPSGSHVAFCAVGDTAAAAYVTDLQTGSTRRLRPLTFCLFLGGPSLTGSAAWSPLGDLLGLTAYGHPPRQMHYHGASAVWLTGPRGFPDD